MKLTEKQKNQLRGASSNLIYAWISETNLKYCGSPKAIKIITKKRENQLRFMANVGSAAGGNYAEVRQFVEQCIFDTYGMKPDEVVYRLAKGESVTGRNWTKGVYGISATPKLDFGDGSGITVNSDTGDILDKTGKILNDPNSAMYNEDGSHHGNVVGVDGAYYGCLYNPKTNLYEAFEHTSKDGVITEIQTGVKYTDSEEVAAKNDLWRNSAQLMPFLTGLLNALLTFFGVNPITGKDININQVQDEWVTPTQSTSKASMGLLGGLALLGIIGMSGSFSPGKKDKKNRKKG